MKTLKFIQISDTHLLDKEVKLHNIDISRVVSKILDTIILMDDEIDFILLTGDISENGSFASYFNAKEIFSSINIPTYWIPGNHDNLSNINIINNGQNILPQKSFKKEDINFILLNSVALDSEGHNRSRGVLPISELVFLKNELKSNLTQINVIALHHPPIKSNSWKDERMLENSNAFFEIINQFGNVNLVLFGHQHQSKSVNIGNIHFYSPPAASYQFDKLIKWAFDNKSPGFGLISITIDGYIECVDHYIDYKISPIYNSKI